MAFLHENLMFFFIKVFFSILQCVPHINECVSELNIKLMFGNEVQDSDEDCNEDSWVENWYNNVTESFCPKMSKLIKKSQTASLFINQTIDKKLPTTWNLFVICKVFASVKNATTKEKKRKAKFQETTWNAICIEVCFY